MDDEIVDLVLYKNKSFEEEVEYINYVCGEEKKRGEELRKCLDSQIQNSMKWDDGVEFVTSNSFN